MISLERAVALVKRGQMHKIAILKDTSVRVKLVVSFCKNLEPRIHNNELECPFKNVFIFQRLLRRKKNYYKHVNQAQLSLHSFISSQMT